MKNRHFRLNNTALNLILMIISFIMILPWLVALSTALKAPGESQINPGLIPQQIDFSKFVTVFWKANVPVLAVNSIIVTGATVIIVLLLSSLAAYGFGRLDF